jgi:hypothetical protein
MSRHPDPTSDLLTYSFLNKQSLESKTAQVRGSFLTVCLLSWQFSLISQISRRFKIIIQEFIAKKRLSIVDGINNIDIMFGSEGEIGQLFGGC